MNALHPFPTFSKLDYQTIPDKLEQQLEQHLKKIDQLTQQNTPFTWDNLIRPLDELDNELERFWSPIGHLHAVVNSKPLRVCYQACLPKLSAYETAIGQNEALYRAIKSIDQTTLTPTQLKIIQDTLRDFVLSGVALSGKNKKRFEIITARLSELSNQFENHVLDAVQAFQLHVTDKARLAGLPEHILDDARQLAQEKQLDGWILTLSFPCYHAIITYAEDRTLRQQLHEAYATRASDQGPSAGTFDNTLIMQEILSLRHEMATLLGFEHYAALSLATKMAESCDEVEAFLMSLNQHSHAQAESEMAALRTYAHEVHQLSTLEPWDVAYISEKKRQACYAFSEDALRAYFPLDRVLSGLLEIVKQLYGISFHPLDDVDIWHPDVSCHAIADESGHIRGYIYMDLFARTNKRGGAWMDVCQSRMKHPDGSLQLPIATLTCNFAKPAKNKPPTLSHDEMVTLFHEFGHCLQHVLTQVDELGASGIRGVEWDAVELPSQFFENWCWDKAALSKLSRHVETGDPLPNDLIERLIQSKNFQSAMTMVRQLEFSLFDLKIHAEYRANDPLFVTNVLAQVKQLTAVTPQAAYNRFQHSFSHIFAGGYAAGYYSYKWAEVLSSDAFSRFEDEGIFNAKTGRDFLHSILETGGSRPAKQTYLSFRGRPPTIDALLRHNGINT